MACLSQLIPHCIQSQIIFDVSPSPHSKPHAHLKYPFPKGTPGEDIGDMVTLGKTFHTATEMGLNEAQVSHYDGSQFLLWHINAQLKIHQTDVPYELTIL